MSDPSPRPVPPSPKRGAGLPTWRILVWILVIWVAVSLLQRVYGGGEPDVHDIFYSQFRAQLRDDNVAEITVKGQRITGAYREAVPPPASDATSTATS